MSGHASPLGGCPRTGLPLNTTRKKNDTIGSVFDPTKLRLNVWLPTPMSAVPGSQHVTTNSPNVFCVDVRDAGATGDAGLIEGR